MAHYASMLFFGFGINADAGFGSEAAGLEEGADEEAADGEVADEEVEDGMFCSLDSFHSSPKSSSSFINFKRFSEDAATSMALRFLIAFFLLSISATSSPFVIRSMKHRFADH